MHVPASPCQPRPPPPAAPHAPPAPQTLRAKEVKSPKAPPADGGPGTQELRQELKATQAALTVALTAVGIPSIEAAQQPGMPLAADEHHNKFVNNDNLLLDVTNR